jgi:hypothetical protein
MQEGLSFSTRSKGLPGTRQLSGKKYSSADDALFREGNSGLAKIAALAATLLDQDTEIWIHERRYSFHLWIPMWKA